MYTYKYPIIVGPRYDYKDCRPGSGPSVVLEVDGQDWQTRDKNHEIEVPRPIAGTIVKVPRTLNPDDEWWNNPKCITGWFARCLNCFTESRTSMQKNDPNMKRWARRHRCKYDD